MSSSTGTSAATPTKSSSDSATEARSFTSFGTFVTAVCVAVLLVIIVKSILTLTVSNALSLIHISTTTKGNSGQDKSGYR